MTYFIRHKGSWEDTISELFSEVPRKSMTQESANLADPPSKAGCLVKLHDPLGSDRRSQIIEDILHRQIGCDNVCFTLQRIKHEDGSEEFRFGYYVIGKKPRMKGKWVWGQYCPLVPKADFEGIISEAKKRGWLDAC